MKAKQVSPYQKVVSRWVRNGALLGCAFMFAMGSLTSPANTLFTDHLMQDMIRGLIGGYASC